MSGVFGFGYDEEATIQEGDIEMAELEARAHEESMLRKKGICRHGWTGPKKDSNTGEFACYHCNKVWPSENERNLNVFGLTK